MAIEPSGRTEELNGAPLADVIHAVAMAVADGQFEMDKASLRAAEFMSGRMLLRDLESGQLASAEGKPADTPTYVDTRILFGYQHQNGVSVENRLSMMELGFVPSFYQFVDTVIDMKLTLRLRRHRAESGSLTTTEQRTGASRASKAKTVITTTPVDARYSSSYNFTAEMTSRVKTKIVPVPPPSILEERIRVLIEQDRERSAVESARKAGRALSGNPLGGPQFAEDRCYEIGNVKTAQALVTGAFTVEAWVRPGAIVGDRAVFAIWTEDGTTARGWLLGLLDEQFIFRLATSGAQGVTTVQAPFVAAPERWHHLAAVYDGAEMLLYVDGVVRTGSIEQSGAILYPAQGRLLIGCHDSPRRKPFAGRIDDVRLWNRVRTAVEIKSTKDYRLEGNEPGLTGYWRLDRYKDKVVPDQTAARHDAQERSP